MLLSATAVVVATVAALYWAQIIFVPITLAIFLAFLLTPPVVEFSSSADCIAGSPCHWSWASRL